ncbi:MAG: Smr/MutS family protein [Rhodospirillaceae bacterium]|jgi:DNA-nicking Smr family endonuclease|nr:Smr/MutS family protein [Rhodospirillaceae bacterium]
MIKDRTKRVVSGEEIRLWHDMMHGVKKFSKNNNESFEQKSYIKPKEWLPLQIARQSSFISSSSDDTKVKTSELLAQRSHSLAIDYRHVPGLDKSTASRFINGLIDIDATIDLHGLTIPMAHTALFQFIINSIDFGRRCLLVITGKGNHERSGVLKIEVPKWLDESNLRSKILAFTLAKSKHGGSGAFYVLLKRRR